ncbi:hypothetical protein WJX77_008642 [Trebouxia sp. C0004]
MGQKSSKAPQIEARYLAPQKLYCYSEVDLRKLRKLIKDRKLAPCFPGVDSESRELEDCPICFLKFPSLNRAVCCHKPICTECFLQVKSLQAGHCPKCPYCKADFSIYFHGPISGEQKLKHQAEEQQQALAAKRAQQEERRQSQQSLEQHLPAAPCCPAAYESGSHIPSSSRAKVLQQTHDALQQYGDFLPHDLSALAEAFHYDIDLNEVMFMQGLCASLQPPDSAATAAAGIPAGHDGGHHSASHSIPIPAQAACNAQSARQRTRSSPGLGLSQAESIQAKSYRPRPSRTATLSASPIEELTDGSSTALQQSDGSVRITVHMGQQSGSMQSDSQEASSSCCLDQASGNTVMMLAANRPPAGTCISSDCVSGDSTKPLLQSGSSSRCSGYGTAHSRGRISGTGNTLAGFLQEQARAGQQGSQALRPQPASGTHELTVGMVLTEFSFVPAAKKYGVSSLQGSASKLPQSAMMSTGASSPYSVKDQGGLQAADSHIDSGKINARAVASSPEAAHNDLTGGAVLLHNPDGSVQYVVLTSDEQKAVQLSLQARQHECTKGDTDVDAYQVACSPEDQAMQEAIATGDAILLRLYQPRLDTLQQRTASAACEAHSSWGINTARDSDVQRDALLKRMEDQDARLRAMYAAG